MDFCSPKSMMPNKDTFIKIVYDSILYSAKKRGARAGHLIWLLFLERVEYMADGFYFTQKHDAQQLFV